MKPSGRSHLRINSQFCYNRARATTLPSITIAGRAVDTHLDHFGALTPSSIDDGFDTLRARFTADGYL
jgi:hypothetical protein